MACGTSAKQNIETSEKVKETARLIRRHQSGDGSSDGLRNYATNFHRCIATAV